MTVDEFLSVFSEPEAPFKSNDHLAKVVMGHLHRSLVSSRGRATEKQTLSVLLGAQATLQRIAEYGIPSDLHEIMDGEKIN